MGVEEIDKITSLLLGLSGRLARTENAINSMTSEQNMTMEREILEDKRAKLVDQLNEAKQLKESIDRRSLAVSQFLQKHLSEETFEDYEHFVKMKSKLILDSKEINDKIRLGEEQIKALKESMQKVT